MGSLFFVPLVGAAAGAGAGVLYQHLQGVGLTKEQLDSIKERTTPGTSVLFAVTDEGDLDRLGERFRRFDGQLVSTTSPDPSGPCSSRRSTDTRRASVVAGFEVLRVPGVGTTRQSSAHEPYASHHRLRRAGGA
ncbi:MAG: DUF1269 domain-containing protein [Lapillicoccus sp.]